MLQLFQHYFGITDKSRKNRIFHCFFDFWPWSRNNYVMIPTTWQFPVTFSRKNYTSKLNFEKKHFFDPRKGSQVPSQNRKTTDLGCRTEFFFVEKEVHHSFFSGEMYRRLPYCCNYSNIISGSQSKFEKTEFSIVFSTFDRDPEIII